MLINPSPASPCDVNSPNSAKAAWDVLRSLVFASMKGKRDLNLSHISLPNDVRVNYWITSVANMITGSNQFVNRFQ